MFGLPLLISFYEVQYYPSSLLDYVVPYVLVSLIVGVLLIRGVMPSKLSKDGPGNRTTEIFQTAKKSGYRNAVVALAFATLSVFSYWIMRHYVEIAYPDPSSSIASIAAIIYLVSIAISCAFGVPFLLTHTVPLLERAFSTDKRYTRIAAVVGMLYFLTYLILVNQVIITGFNTPPGNFVPSPTGSFPFGFVFTSGPPPNSAIESSFYVPQIVLQLNQYVNLLILPFEIIFATILSALVAAIVVATLYFIKRTSNASCLTGMTFSGLGGFFGFTATCPTCLVPTLISVFFGGLSASVPSIYSHLSGVILPPIVSLFALVSGLAILNWQSKKLEFNLKTVPQILSK
jgi:hypothetical protein